MFFTRLSLDFSFEIKRVGISRDHHLMEGAGGGASQFTILRFHYQELLDFSGEGGQRNVENSKVALFPERAQLECCTEVGLSVACFICM